MSDHQPDSPPPRDGLRGALNRIATHAMTLAHTRIALAGVELAEERDRVKTTLMLAIVGVVFGAFALMAATLLIVAAFWDSHRLSAIAAVALIYAAIAAGALWRAAAIRRAAPAPFAATLAELDKDREQLKRVFGQ
jgi:uncharacterized membrane protein YqjE